MPDAAAAAARHTRGKVRLPLRAGERVALPVAEWGYRTPSYPQGLKTSTLKTAGPAVQRETMLVWFLLNFIPLSGPVFGFAGAAEPTGMPLVTPDASPRDTVPSGDAGYGGRHGDAYGGLQVVGFDQGPWSTGVPAAGLLAKEFGTLFDPAMVATVTDVLPGLWLPRPDELSRDGDLVLTDPASALPGLLDRIDDLVRELLPEAVGRGHNRSPEGSVEPEGLPDDFRNVPAPVRGTVLRATADMRLALSSGDHPALAIAWQATVTAVKAIGAAVSAQIRMLYGDGPAATALRTGAAGLAISFIGMELDLIDRTGAAGIIVAAIGMKMLGRK